MLEFRKRPGWSTKDLPGGRGLRQRLFRLTILAAVERTLEEYLDEHRTRAEAA